MIIKRKIDKLYDTPGTKISNEDNPKYLAHKLKLESNITRIRDSREEVFNYLNRGVHMVCSMYNKPVKEKNYLDSSIKLYSEYTILKPSISDLLSTKNEGHMSFIFKTPEIQILRDFYIIGFTPCKQLFRKILDNNIRAKYLIPSIFRHLDMIKDYHIVRVESWKLKDEESAIARILIHLIAKMFVSY